MTRRLERQIKQLKAGRRVSARAAAKHAQDAHDKATEAAARRRAQRRAGGSNLAQQSAAWQGKPAPKQPGRAESPFQQAKRQANEAQKQAKKAQEKPAEKRRRAPRKRKPNPGGHRSDDPRYQAKSPYYAAGAEDGHRDCLIVANCPPGSPLGQDDNRAWSAMYRTGYEDEWSKAVPHKCTAECKRNRGETGPE